MKMLIYISIVLIALSVLAYAEIYKCKHASGEVAYQSEPCQINEIPLGVVKVKEMTPDEAEAAKAKLKVWQEKQAADEAAKLKAQKEQDEELHIHESLGYQRRSAEAEEKQAIEAEQRRQIDERRTRNLLNP